MDTTGARTDTDLSKNIGGQIRKARTQRSLTQEELAQRMGTQRPAVSNWENGINLPSVLTLKRMAEVLDVPLAVLIDEANGQGDHDHDDDGRRAPKGDPDTQRWQGMCTRLALGNEQHGELLRSWLRIFEALESSLRDPHGDHIVAVLTKIMEQGHELCHSLLRDERRRKTDLFAREVGLRPEALHNFCSTFLQPQHYMKHYQDLAADSRVLVLTGNRLTGKTCLGLKLLMDLSLAGHRPFFATGRIKTPAESHERLAYMLRSGNAVFLDDILSPNVASLPIREFVAEPTRFLNLAHSTGARLIVATESDRLRWSPDLHRSLHPFEWNIDEEYDEESIRRLTTLYSEALHPQARETITIPLGRLSTPHAIRRVYSVGTDNRQVIRRRAQTVRRDGIEALIHEDLRALSDPQLAMLELIRFAPLAWDKIAKLFTGIDAKGVDGASPDPDAVLESLDDWLLVTGSGCRRAAALAHATYVRALDSWVETERRGRAAAFAVLHTMLSVPNPFVNALAIRMAIWQKDPNIADTARCLIHHSLPGLTGQLVASLGVVLKALTSCDITIRKAFRLMSRSSTTEMTTHAFRWIRENRHELAPQAEESLKWMDGSGIGAGLVASYEFSPDTDALARLLAEAARDEDPAVRMLAAQQCLVYSHRVEEVSGQVVLDRLCEDSHPAVQAALRHGLVDQYARLPVAVRERLATTPEA